MWPFKLSVVVWALLLWSSFTDDMLVDAAPMVVVALGSSPDTPIRAGRLLPQQARGGGTSLPWRDLPWLISGDGSGRKSSGSGSGNDAGQSTRKHHRRHHQKKEKQQQQQQQQASTSPCRHLKKHHHHHHHDDRQGLPTNRVISLLQKVKKVDESAKSVGEQEQHGSREGEEKEEEEVTVKAGRRVFGQALRRMWQAPDVIVSRPVIRHLRDAKKGKGKGTRK